jgi:transposase
MGRYFQTPDKRHGNPGQLLRWANEANNYKEGRRFLCIRMLMMSGEDTTINKAAEIFGVSCRTVNQWLRQWNESGKEGLADTPKPGRPPKFKQKHKERVKHLIENQAEQKARLTIKGIHGFLKG